MTMTATTHPDLDDDLVTKKKHHIFVKYLIADGYYGGGYYDRTSKLIAGVKGTSFDEMHSHCYETFIEGMQIKEDPPFNIMEIKDLVVFDFLECKTIDEMDKADEMEEAGIAYNEIEKAIIG